MSILCRVAGHSPVPSNVWNHGYFFTRCDSCGCEMIGRGGAWRPVPRGYRVVWRRREGDRIDWRPIPIRSEASRLSDMVAVNRGASDKRRAER